VGVCALQIIADRVCHPWSERNQPVFPEFRSANHQELLVKVNVLSLQSAHFAYAQAQTIEKCEYHPIGFASIGSPRVRAQLSGEVEKAPNLVRAEEKWWERRRHSAW
jgi:hypothetical protein